MRLLSINISLPRDVPHNGQTVRTGIYKSPITGPVMLEPTNLIGDGQADLRVHGGPDKAVYLYSSEYYEFWRKELTRDDLTPGQFGENFTTEGMTDDIVHIGDRFQVGDALVEVTQPRLPCFKLGIRMGSPRFPKQFHRSERTGFYCRVLKEGLVTSGQAIDRKHIDPSRVTVQELYRLYFGIGSAAERLLQATNIAALSESWRVDLKEKMNREDRD